MGYLRSAESAMPTFALKFPEKTVWIHLGGDDSTAITIFLNGGGGIETDEHGADMVGRGS